jgi:hypothetical protein
MNIARLKEEIIRKIEETNDIDLLLQIQDVILGNSIVSELSVQYDVESDEDIVAYTVDGKPLTKAEYIADIELAAKEIEEGNFYTTDEVRKIAASWKK